ncbi:MAG: hypothetical protein OHK0022_46530 [Roseiflexaceae bacterium]
MVREIRIYVEGGGDRDADTAIREGFRSFFREIVELVRIRRIGWSIIPCGSRNSAFDNFKNALTGRHRDAFNILLVDSEDPLRGHLWDHLMRRDS